MTTQNKIVIAIAMIVVWAVVLLGIDKILNKHPNIIHKPPIAAAHLRIKFTHFCCNGCYSSLFKAVQKFSWLSEPEVEDNPNLKLSPQEIDQKTGLHHEGQMEDNSGWATIPIDTKQISQVDFINLERTLRDNGLKPEVIQLFGIPRFQLVGEHVHLCCTLCINAAHSGLSVEKNPEIAKLKMSKEPETGIKKEGFADLMVNIEADAKDPVEISTFRDALDRAGTIPSAIKIRLPQ